MCKSFLAKNTFFLQNSWQILYTVYIEGGERMDANTIVQMISNVGFPIACCICLFYMNVKQTQQHKEEVNKITEALNNNTLAIQKLSDKLKNKEE